jgi:hypothetical protein
MSSAAQISANQANAQRSTGPATEAGKARSSRNSTRLGLFSASSFVHEDEKDLYNQFCESYYSDLAPTSCLEETLAREVIQAAWRLRRCTELEATVPGDADIEELDRLQHSIDRARGTAQRTFQRSLTELRRVQTERVYRAVALPENLPTADLGQASCKELKPAALATKKRQADVSNAVSDLRDLGNRLMADITKRTQSVDSEAVPNPRFADVAGARRLVAVPSM